MFSVYFAIALKFPSLMSRSLQPLASAPPFRGSPTPDGARTMDGVYLLGSEWGTQNSGLCG